MNSGYAYLVSYAPDWMPFCAFDNEEDANELAGMFCGQVLKVPVYRHNKTDKQKQEWMKHHIENMPLTKEVTADASGHTIKLNEYA